jgi:hypothetical protein
MGAVLHAELVKSAQAASVPGDQGASGSGQIRPIISLPGTSTHPVQAQQSLSNIPLQAHVKYGWDHATGNEHDLEFLPEAARRVRADVARGCSCCRALVAVVGWICAIPPGVSAQVRDMSSCEPCSAF